MFYKNLLACVGKRFPKQINFFRIKNLFNFSKVRIYFTSGIIYFNYKVISRIACELSIQRFEIQTFYQVITNQ